jgi:hypothetical protein
MKLRWRTLLLLHTFGAKIQEKKEWEGDGAMEPRISEAEENRE